MAASHTAKKRAKKLAHSIAEEQVLHELLDHYLVHWSKQELGNLIKQNKLIVLSLDNPKGYQIGRFRIWQDNKIWNIRDIINEKDFVFYDKQAGVFYCMFEMLQQYNQSRELKTQASWVKKLDQDHEFFRHKYKIAQQSKNSFALDLCEARLSDIKPRLEFAQEQLQKMITSAKYIKIWDKQP